MPIVTPRVEAAERSANTTPMATKAVAMNGVPKASTTSGQTNPVRWPSTMLAADQPSTRRTRSASGAGPDPPAGRQAAVKSR